jgi:hypothetical protein
MDENEPRERVSRVALTYRLDQPTTKRLTSTVRNLKHMKRRRKGTVQYSEYSTVQSEVQWYNLVRLQYSTVQYSTVQYNYEYMSFC